MLFSKHILLFHEVVLVVLRAFLCLSLSEQCQYLFYPILLVIRLPAAWASSLWASRSLLNGRWSRFMGFHPYNAINSFFYRTQWINLDRYGRAGVSPTIGLGAFPLRKWFHISLPANYFYSHAGALTTLVGTWVWVFSHFVWAEAAPVWWLIAVVFCLLFSSMAYAMAFARQNYQILGWMWFPLGLFFCAKGSLVLASMAWLAASLSGLTAVVFASVVVALSALVSANPMLPLVLLPTYAYTLLSLWPVLSSGGLAGPFQEIGKLIGLVHHQVRYDRGMKRLGVFTLYFLGLYAVSTALLSVAHRQWAWMPLLGMVLFLVNQRFVRIADEQSLLVLNCSLIASSALAGPPSVLAYLAVFLAFNPLAALLSVQRLGKTGGDGSIHVFEPFDHGVIEAATQEFLAPVHPGEQVYFAFEDPAGQYFRIFDGYRALYELPLYLASLKGFRIFPDWYAVMETNYHGAPQCWGRTYKEVLDNCVRWKANFAVIYQESGTSLDPVWLQGFDCVTRLDWETYLPQFRGFEIWSSSAPVPQWFLLRPR